MTVRIQQPHRCVYFCGIQKVCDAGIDPKSVRDSSGPGMYRWPCIALIGDRPCTTACTSYRMQTAEEDAAEEAMTEQACVEFEARMKSALCPHCGSGVSQVRQVGKCVYAGPCGHRVGHGTVEAVATAMGVPVAT